MNKKIILVLTPLLLIFGLVIFKYINQSPTSPPQESTEAPYPTLDDKTEAVIKAKEVYKQAQQQNLDLSSGPCLSNNLIPDWVLDIAHNPRTSVDDQPENQCPAFRSGQAHHFVELDPNGNLIRTY